MPRRIAALLFAVAIIAGALAIRGWADDREGGGAPAPGRTTSSMIDPDEVFRDRPVALLCAEELAAVCERLKGAVRATRVEPAWSTVERLAGGGALGADAWLTLRPLNDMAVPPSPAVSTLGSALPLGRSPIVLAGPTQVVFAVTAACRDPRVLLSCAAALPAVQMMLRDPTTSAAGTLALSVLADELGLPAPGMTSDGRAAGALAAVLARSRFTAVPYEDVARLKAGTLALTLEADVVESLGDMDYGTRRDYAGAQALYPFEARAVEAVAVPERSFDRTADLATLLSTAAVGATMERIGFEPLDRRAFLFPKRVFAGRPSIRTDLPPPAPDRLRQLRSLPRPPATTPATAPASP